MNSALFKAKTFHQRFTPKKHKFSYKLLYLLLDLDEAYELGKKLKYLGVNSSNVYSFYERDHVLKGQRTLKESVFFQVKQKYPDFKITSIRLLTHMRTFGFIFNPVCYYFVLGTNNEALILIEVMNTYHEHKNYLSDVFRCEKNTFEHTQIFDKNFYVSPYSSSLGKMEYIFKCNLEGDIYIAVKNYENNITNVYADIKGRPISLNNKNLFHSIFSYPFLTLRVWLAIHFHALILFFKGIKFYKKAEEINHQKGYDIWKQQLKRNQK